MDHTRNQSENCVLQKGFLNYLPIFWWFFKVPSCLHLGKSSKNSKSLFHLTFLVLNNQLPKTNFWKSSLSLAKSKVGTWTKRYGCWLSIFYPLLPSIEYIQTINFNIQNRIFSKNIYVYLYIDRFTSTKNRIFFAKSSHLLCYSRDSTEKRFQYVTWV